MKIGNLFRKFISGNYEIITRNWTCSYYRLCDSHKDLFVSPETMMVAAAVISSNMELKSSHFVTTDLEFCAMYASSGHLGLTPTMSWYRGLRAQGYLESFYDYDEKGKFSSDGIADFKLMVNFCAQLIVLTTSVHSPRIVPFQLINIVSDNRSKIEKSIEQLNYEIAQGESNSYVKNMNVGESMMLKKDAWLTPYLLPLIKESKGGIAEAIVVET